MKKFILLFAGIFIILILQSCVILDDTVEAKDTTVQQSGNFCQDKSYTENTVFPDADISSFVDAYTPENAIQFRSNVLMARYPMGEYIMQTSHNNGVCDEYWNEESLTGTDDVATELKNLYVVVHECGHGLDGWLSVEKGPYYNGHFIHPDVTLYTKGGYIEGDPNPSFPNYLLQGDEYGTGDWQACPNDVYDGCDTFADVDMKNDFMGNQGFETITEELTQFINSLALSYAFHEFYNGKTSNRNGLLNFMMYLERYLLMARTEHADFYNYISQDEDWKKLIGTLWDRSWYYYELTRNIDALSIQPEETMAYNIVTSEKLINEICKIRGMDPEDETEDTNSTDDTSENK